MSPSKASQWVCVTNITGDKVESDPILIQLKHPKTGKPARFSLHEGKLCEIQKVDPEEKRSWFINDTVQQDGSLFFFTPVDPLFLLIPILETSRQETHESGGVFQQLDDILSNEEEFSYRHITELAGIDQQLNHICDSKAITDTIHVYRLNNEKVLTWLKCKVEMILEHFDSVPGLNQLILFLDSPELSSEQRQNLRRRAIVQTLGDYLSLSWRDKLLNAYE
ncbi:hypothetical protein K7432_003069 [Basidiobolus ranarum]|uniref:Ribonuclease H2 subunit B n=1 Tax=Basidiobolus ranarum TaxID=34480 RepID=A0ABR2W6T1_9FUNG